MKFASNQEAWDAGYAIREYSLSDAADKWFTPTGVIKTIGCPKMRSEPPGMILAKLEDIERHVVKPKVKQ